MPTIVKWRLSEKNEIEQSNQHIEIMLWTSQNSLENPCNQCGKTGNVVFLHSKPVAWVSRENKKSWLVCEIKTSFLSPGIPTWEVLACSTVTILSRAVHQRQEGLWRSETTLVGWSEKSCNSVKTSSVAWNFGFYRDLGFISRKCGMLTFSLTKKFLIGMSLFLQTYRNVSAPRRSSHIWVIGQAWCQDAWNIFVLFSCRIRRVEWGSKLGVKRAGTIRGKRDCRGSGYRKKWENLCNIV